MCLIQLEKHPPQFDMCLIQLEKHQPRAPLLARSLTSPKQPPHFSTFFAAINASQK